MPLGSVARNADFLEFDGNKAYYLSFLFLDI